MNFRNEREHDWLLISLVQELNEQNQLKVFSKHFLGGVQVNRLIRAQRRRPFDIEITFDNLSCIFETKVDSDESGRFNGLGNLKLILHSIYLKDGVISIRTNTTSL